MSTSKSKKLASISSLGLKSVDIDKQFLDQLSELKDDKSKTNEIIDKIIRESSKKLSALSSSFSPASSSSSTSQTFENVALNDLKEEFNLIRKPSIRKLISRSNSLSIRQSSSAPGPLSGFSDLIAPQISISSTNGTSQSQNEPSNSSIPLIETKSIDSSLLQKATSESFRGFHHITWYCSNAKQTAQYFIVSFGFRKIAYRGLETAFTGFSSHVVSNGHIIFEFVSPIYAKSSEKAVWLVDEMHRFVQKHGDGVKDVSFEVDDVDLVYKNAIKSGAKSITEPTFLRDKNGTMKVATIQIVDDLFHTLIENVDYEGVYLPNYHTVKDDPRYDMRDAVALNNLPPVKLDIIDHCVQNEDWNTMNIACGIYSKAFGFHQFWSVDERDISTKYSALRSIVMASANEMIKIPINEPAKGMCKSQIEEFLDFYNGPGVQHIAVTTPDIIETITNMKARGVEFIQAPDIYYDHLLPRLLEGGISIEEDLNLLKKLNILIDFDDNGYLLQIFTKPLTDRPTFFMEVIQRHNHDGFGKGNFKALFESIEDEQRLRGTLERICNEPEIDEPSDLQYELI
ncbi:hypothetical protein WICMUC_004638 [Wickerhamomyces mucosus]|uniref:4-hydroxyphenylpyruvate dioxygenase n=1 Tax=Wickerhamomyces mucosus TaxID=1378264 RepID=A0A9P8PHM2_9ASCO|nr:hypothetical protein WICMUC_004638 [Wickerhamomyces mucosus]